MNWLDIILIIANAIIILIGIIMIPVAIVERIKDEYSDMPEVTAKYWLTYIFIGWIIWALPFLVIDKSSGSTVGTITSVDKNFWGTTALYIKSTETNEEKYCIEYNEELEEKAKELIGKKVKVSYGKRVGFYSTGKCKQAPIETIEELEEK